MSEHNHGPWLVACAKCGAERWCGFGPCSDCGEQMECPLNHESTDTGERAMSAENAENAENAWRIYARTTNSMQWTCDRRAFMAGRASRDAEVAELRRNGEAQLARLRANWENECGNLEMAEREVESLRQQLADAAEYLAGVKEADDSELQYRDEVEIPALRQQLAKEHENGLILAKDAHEDRMTAAALRQQLAELHDLVESIDDQRERAEQQHVEARDRSENHYRNALKWKERAVTAEEQLAERDAVITRVRAFNDEQGWSGELRRILDAAPSSTLDALIQQEREAAVLDYVSNKEIAKVQVKFTNQPMFDALIRQKQAEALEGWADEVQPHFPVYAGKTRERAAKYRNGADHE